jgi:hypothetical protein
MKYLTKTAFLASFFVLLGWARAQEDDGEAANYSFAYGASRSNRYIDGSASYSRYFTDDVYVSFNTSLGDQYNTREKRSIENRAINTQVTFDPTSPWYLSVIYRNSKNYNYRPRGPDLDEYKALTISNSLSSSLRYTYRDDLRTYFDVSLSKSRQESIVAGSPNPDTSSESKRVSVRADYDVTSNTTLNGSYEGGVSKSEFTGSRYWRTDPVTPARIGRTRTNRLNGSLDSNNVLTDSISFDSSLSVNLGADRDDLILGLTKDYLSGFGAASLTYNPVSEFTLDLSSNLSRSKTYYPYKDDYEKTFGAPIFDSVDRNWGNDVTMTISPSPQVSTNISYERSDVTNRRYEEDNVLPKDPDAVSNIYDRLSETVRSNVDLSIGDDLTFHLSYYLTTLETDYILDPPSNTKTVSNNLDSNIGYDFTDTLRADVNTNMSINKDTYDHPSAAVENKVSSDITLGNTFTYRVSDDTKLTSRFNISAARTEYENAPESNREVLGRNFGGSIDQDFSDVLDVTMSADVGLDQNNLPYRSQGNIRSEYFKLSPRVVLDVSEALTLTTSFSFNRDKEWKPNDENWEETWRQTDDYNTSLNMTYRVFEDFNVNFSAINTHQLKISDKNLREKTYPDESYFNVSVSANYQW